MKRLRSRLYHLSQSNLDGKLLVPQVPFNAMTKSGYEDCTLARICFAKNIDDCLLALGKEVENLEYFVHEPIDYTRLNIISNDEIVKNGWVADAYLTGETWVINPVMLKKIGKIRVLTAIDDYVTYTYDDGRKSANAYYWNYEVLE